jgi:uncharacterized protein YegP (UPF0339 family)
MHFEVYPARTSANGQKGKWRWRLRQNGRTIATSGEGYVDRSHCVHEINRIKENRPDAEVKIQAALPAVSETDTVDVS